MKGKVEERPQRRAYSLGPLRNSSEETVQADLQKTPHEKFNRNSEWLHEGGAERVGLQNGHARVLPRRQE